MAIFVFHELGLFLYRGVLLLLLLLLLPTTTTTTTATTTTTTSTTTTIPFFFVGFWGPGAQNPKKTKVRKIRLEMESGTETF